MTDSPITPPPKLLSRWEEDWHHGKVKHTELEDHIATQAAQWGADQELEACVNYIDNNMSGNKAREFRAIRRPKPPSLKEQALLAIDTAVADGRLSPDVSNVVRRALEALDD